MIEVYYRVLHQQFAEKKNKKKQRNKKKSEKTFWPFLKWLKNLG